MRRFVLAVGAIVAIGASAVTAAAYAVPAATTPVAVLVATPSEVSAPGDGSNPCVLAPPYGWTCTIYLHETDASTEPLTWFSAGDMDVPVTSTPGSGKLYPGQTVKVKVNAGCNGWAAFDFIYDARGLPENGVAVAYACG